MTVITVRMPATTSLDRFRTVAGAVETSILITASKFIARLSPASGIDDHEAALKTARSRFPDASHHCWAYRLGRPDVLIDRSSDAGEPNGTAGRPILDALRSAQLENVSCIVTRYFGGTKLGTGGLVRAYGDAARAAIAEASIVERTIVREISLSFEHSATGAVYRVLEELGLHLRPGQYDERAHGTVLVPLSLLRTLIDRLEASARGMHKIITGKLELI